MFSTLGSLLGSFSGVTVLDLYAGSGALGLEALSRGAIRATLVEKDARACRAIQSNIAVVALPGAVFHQREVGGWLATSPPSCADVVFLDPPYEESDEQVQQVLFLLQSKGHIETGGIVVVERSTRSEPWEWVAPWLPLQDRRYGEAHLWLATISDASDPATLSRSLRGLRVPRTLW